MQRRLRCSVAVNLTLVSVAGTHSGLGIVKRISIVRSLFSSECRGWIVCCESEAINSWGLWIPACAELNAAAFHCPASPPTNLPGGQELADSRVQLRLLYI